MDTTASFNLNKFLKRKSVQNQNQLLSNNEYCFWFIYLFIFLDVWENRAGYVVFAAEEMKVVIFFKKERKMLLRQKKQPRSSHQV